MQTPQSLTPSIAFLKSIDARNCEKSGTIGSPETADAAPLRARRRYSFYNMVDELQPLSDAMA